MHITYEGKPIEEVSHYNYLGVKLDQTLKYDQHAKAVIQRVSDKHRYLKLIRRFITSAAALSIYKKHGAPYSRIWQFLIGLGQCSIKEKTTKQST